MTETNLETLQRQLDVLQAQLVQLLPAAPSPSVVEQAEPTPPARPVKIYSLVGSPDLGYLHRDPRTVRQLVEAVGLAMNAPVRSLDVLAEWVPLLRRVASARASGATWPAALAAAGLELPDDLSGQALALRRELDAVWGQLRALVSMSLPDLGDVAKDALLTSLRQLLT